MSDHDEQIVRKLASAARHHGDAINAGLTARSAAQATVTAHIAGNAIGSAATDLRDVLDAMSEGFALLGPDFTILDMNAEALRLETRSRDQLIGQSHWDAFPGSEDGSIGQAYKRAIRDNVPVTLEHHYRWEDGRSAWLNMRAYPVAGGRLAVFYRDITDRRVTDVQLRESEQRFRSAAEAFADVLWTNDADGKMTGDQPGWAAMTGQPFADYQGYGWANAVHPDDAAPTIAAWNAAVAERRLFAFEHRVRRHDGVWRRFAIRAVPVSDDDGRLREWVGVHHDITDLRENELRLRQIAENIDAVFYVHEIDEQRISYVSPAYERIWQQPAAALYEDTLSFMRDIHPDDRAPVEAALQRRRAGETNEARYRLVRADGSIRHIYDRSFVTRHLDSSARRVVGLAEDVTATTEARLLLQRNAETFETLVRDNPFGVYVVDSGFRLAQVSQGARSVFDGIAPLLGRDFAEILRIVWQEPFATEAIAHFRHTLETGTPFTSAKAIVPRGNLAATQAYDWRIDRIILPDGSYGIVCYFYDLSERMALEASLQQALAEKDMLLRDKDMLLREIDHRVRNSLSMASSLLSLQSRSSQAADTKQALALAASRIHAIARVHERLYKSEALGIVEFGGYLEEICADLRISLVQDNVKIVVNTVAVDLRVDQAVPLGLITNELVTNAFKHCGDGTVTITVTLTRTADSYTLTVSDTGVGMASTASPHQGLGMQVIKALARQLRGAIALPEPGGSATFAITVPAAS